VYSIPRPTRQIAMATLSLALIGCLTGTEAPIASDPATDTYAASLGVTIAAMTKTSAHLYFQDLVVGTGADATVGKTVGVTYTGWLVTGTKFDSNVGKAVFSFPLGAHYVIDGWDLGVAGMKVGGKRRLVIGSALGYGAAGSPPVIPPNSTLVFDVELLSVK